MVFAAAYLMKVLPLTLASKILLNLVLVNEALKELIVIEIRYINILLLV